MTYLQTTKYDPLNTLGFDRIFDRMAQMTATPQSQTSYPPYNIIKTDDEYELYTIEIALAGFKEEDIDIELKDGELTIEGNSGQQEDDREYVHKGIAARAFTRKFTLVDTILVQGAVFKDGILSVYLENIIPEEEKPKKVEINGDFKSHSNFMSDSKEFLAE
jgi:molecular chaperone IbpA